MFYIFTACYSTDKEIDAQASHVTTIESANKTTYQQNDNSNAIYIFNTNSEINNNIIIDNQVKSELKQIIECYYYLKDLFGGRYCNFSEGYEIRSLDEEYLQNKYTFNSKIKYVEFDIDESFYPIFDENFFRNENCPKFSSSEISQKTYDEIALLYITRDCYSSNFYGLFNDIITDDDYIVPSKYWSCDGKILINSTTDYMYGGYNDYSYFDVTVYTEKNVVVIIKRKYDEKDSHVQFEFINENNMWKISGVKYLD